MDIEAKIMGTKIDHACIKRRLSADGWSDIQGSHLIALELSRAVSRQLIRLIMTPHWRKTPSGIIYACEMDDETWEGAVLSERTMAPFTCTLEGYYQEKIQNEMIEVRVKLSSSFYGKHVDFAPCDSRLAKSEEYYFPIENKD